VGVAALGVGALLAQAGLAAPASAAGPRYASPTGTSAQNCLTPATACNLDQAVNQAGSGDEVIVSPGTYDLGGTGLTNSQSNVNVHGVAGQPRPMINSSADQALALFGSGAKVADLTINQTGDGHFGLQVFSSGILVQRVEVHSTAADACALGYSGTARDLLCVSTAAEGAALEDSWTSGFGVLSLRNVTAVATGVDSYGIRADSTGDNTNLFVVAENVIASGTKADIRSTEVGSSSESNVILAYSNYDTIEEGGGGDVTGVGSTRTNQTALPVYADTATYHQSLTSPTIDQGTSDASVGSNDLDGDPRKIGVAVDIGVDEFDPTPPDVAFDHTPKHKTHKNKAIFTFHASEAATFSCAVDTLPMTTCSSPLKLRFKKRGKHTVTVSATDAVGNVDPTPATYTWKIKKKKKKHHKPHHGQHH
jgi:hypothetical protein